MKPNYVIGTSGWNYEDWRGIFYPKLLAKAHWLNYYANRFKIVEINATFYRFFSKQVYNNWYQQTPDDFKIIIKVHRLISHFKMLKNCRTYIKQCCLSTKALKEKWGFTLLQLPPKFPYDATRLKLAINSFENNNKLVIEFRDKKWFTPEVKKLLIKTGCVFCITDSPDFTAPKWLTSDVAYIRLHGKKSWYNYNYTEKELKEIAKWAHHLVQKGAKTVYILFNNDYKAYAIQNALLLNKILNH